MVSVHATGVSIAIAVDRVEAVELAQAMLNWAANPTSFSWTVVLGTGNYRLDFTAAPGWACTMIKDLEAKRAVACTIAHEDDARLLGQAILDWAAYP